MVTKSSSQSSSTKKYGGWKTMPYILGNETFERMAVFGLFTNFTVYLTTKLHLQQVYAINIISLWFGLSNFGPLIGAFISDAYLGRFRTIAFASITSLLGMIMVTLTASLPELHPPPCTLKQLALGQCVRASKSQLGALILGLCLLAIGSSGIRPCSIPFGIDQFDPTTEEGKKGINSYFNWYYTTFTLVLLVSQTLVIYIQDSISWKLGFAIPTLCMFFSIIMFLVGSRVYVHVKPEGSMFTGFAQVLVAAYRKRKLKLPSEDKVDGVFYDPPLSCSTVLSKLPLTKQFRGLNKAALIMEGDLDQDGKRVNEWKLVSIQQVEEVKCLRRVLPILPSGIISVIPMMQLGTLIVLQAMKMDRHLGPKFQIPAGSIGVISFTTIALWVPFYDRFLVPHLRKFTKQENGITPLQRIGVGMVFSILSMVVAGLVEKMRRESENSNPNPNPFGVSPMSVFWLAPPLILMGFCEAFTGIGQIEFFNKQFPEHMTSIGNSLFPICLGGASYVSSIILNTVHHATRRHGHPDWLANDANVGKIDYFYYLIAGIEVLNLICFILVTRRFEYKVSVDLQCASPQDVELGSQKV